MAATIRPSCFYAELITNVSFQEKAIYISPGINKIQKLGFVIAIRSDSFSVVGALLRPFSISDQNKTTMSPQALIDANRAECEEVYRARILPEARAIKENRTNSMQESNSIPPEDLKRFVQSVYPSAE